MNYLEKLTASSEKFNSIVCLGLDPVIADIPEEGAPGDQVYRFYESILNKIVQKKVFPGAVKPNYAFYAQYGISGIETLVNIISIYKKEGLPVILDVKRGDIGTTAQAYAKEAYEFFKADAVTLAPYMGFDSIRPFIEHSPDCGCYILTKTSNKSSAEIQDIIADGSALYAHVAKKIVSWYYPGIGSVVGATYPEQLAEIADIYTTSGKEVPLLIPGIGSQGGDLEAVMTVLKRFHSIKIHRINSSSGINYAYKKYTDMHYADAAVKALQELNDKINEHQ